MLDNASSFLFSIAGEENRKQLNYSIRSTGFTRVSQTTHSQLYPEYPFERDQENRE